MSSENIKIIKELKIILPESYEMVIFIGR